MLYGFLRFVFRLIFYILFRSRVYGRENIPAEGAVILAANHASNIDPPLMASLIDRALRESDLQCGNSPLSRISCEARRV